MAGDAGDDFAQESQQNTSQMLSFLMYRAGMKGASGGSQGQFGGDPKGGLSQVIASAFKSCLPSREHNSDTESQTVIEQVDMRGDKDIPETVEVLVDNDADYEFMKSVLDKNNIEYTVSHETAPDAVFSLDSRTYSDGADIAVFRLPQHDIADKAVIHAPFSQHDHVLIASDHPFLQLKDADPELIGLFSNFSRQSMIEKWALRGAIDELAKDGLIREALGSDEIQPFQAGAKQNIIAEFTTVKWDPQARIISDPLEHMGVPFELSIKDGVAYFEVPDRYVPAFKAIADFHLSNEASHISSRRFPNYDVLEISTTSPDTKTELIEVTVADKGAATLLKDEFTERAIPFESLTSRTTGESTLLVSKQELINKAPELMAAQREFEAVKRTPKKTANKRVRQQKAERDFGRSIKKPAIAFEDSKVSSARKPTPARDQRAASKSARARNLTQTKKLNRSTFRLSKTGRLSS